MEKSKVLCIAEEERAKKLEKLLTENFFDFLKSKGALKAGEILEKEGDSVKLILWNIEKEFGNLQHELAEVFNQYQEIPVLILSKTNFSKEELGALLQSDFRILDFFEGDRFILKEIHSIIYGAKTPKEGKSNSREYQKDSLEFNQLFSKNLEGLELNPAPTLKISNRPKVTAEEKDMLRQSTGESDFSEGKITNFFKKIFS